MRALADDEASFPNAYMSGGVFWVSASCPEDGADLDDVASVSRPESLWFLNWHQQQS
ncbi:hypothetical protein CC78DRAFT_574909 [Lojkania enalia]|uniref:Uncharacterized protein n=1 Tax=Lojkania enalia TaxID=147567 RepID=A0A9P4NA12_9PLEO|nr:hypothetical protein CC78DRAFT_574909 [Didymosphaeria enalia]